MTKTNEANNSLDSFRATYETFQTRHCKRAARTGLQQHKREITTRINKRHQKPTKSFTDKHLSCKLFVDFVFFARTAMTLVARIETLGVDESIDIVNALSRSNIEQHSHIEPVDCRLLVRNAFNTQKQNTENRRAKPIKRTLIAFSMQSRRCCRPTPEKRE